jgi:hypothetical protein
MSLKAKREYHIKLVNFTMMKGDFKKVFNFKFNIWISYMKLLQHKSTDK